MTHTQEKEYGGFSFYPKEEDIKKLFEKFNHYREREFLKGARNQVITFWDDYTLSLLKQRKFLYQKDGIFHFSEDISYETGDVFSTQKTKDIGVCEPLGLKGFISNEKIKKVLSKGQPILGGLIVRPVETFVIRSLTVIEIVDEQKNLIKIKIFKGENSKKSQLQNQSYQLRFGILKAKNTGFSETFSRVKEILENSIHQINHPLVDEMVNNGRFMV